MVLSAEKKQVLMDEMRELLNEYDYKTTDAALEKIIDEWFKNKGALIEILSKHPNWNEDKWHIAFDQDFQRKVDRGAINRFFSHYLGLRDYEDNSCLVKKVIDGKTYEEVYNEREKLYWLAEMYNATYRGNRYLDAETTRLNGMTKEEVGVQYREVRRLFDKFNGDAYEEGSQERYNTIGEMLSYFYYYYEETLTGDAVRKIKRYLPDIRVAEGQKTSRAVNKILQELGVDKMKESDGTVQYNKNFAKYSDAINSLMIKRHTVISVNPIDYLTMSFGNSWSSCHTIDKRNKRNKGGDGYQGCYSSGTMSYMLDGSSMVFYTVDKDYDGVDYELQDKINRNMFHFANDKLVQGRVYPQCNDGDGGLYGKIREIVQKVMADCLEIPNMWVVKKDSDVRYDYTETYGTHYEDYTHYDSCNISFIKSTENCERVKIGHDPIDVYTGETHDCEETVQPSADD